MVWRATSARSYRDGLFLVREELRHAHFPQDEVNGGVQHKVPGTGGVLEARPAQTVMTTSSTCILNLVS